MDVVGHHLRPAQKIGGPSVCWRATVEAKSNQQRLSHRVPMRQAAPGSPHTPISGVTRANISDKRRRRPKGRRQPQRADPTGRLQELNLTENVAAARFGGPEDLELTCP